MPKVTNTNTETEVVELITEPVTKATTNWQVFKDAGLVPTSIRCDGYSPTHPVNIGCHTLLTLDADSMIRHFKGDHGGGFVIQFRRSDSSRPWPGWDVLANSGIELIDFRCAVCNNELPLDARFILQHMLPHKNGNRRTETGGRFYMTISDQAINYEYN